MTTYKYIGPFDQADVVLPTRVVTVNRNETIEALDTEDAVLDTNADWLKEESPEHTEQENN